jgi:hypothetical protein
MVFCKADEPDTNNLTVAALATEGVGVAANAWPAKAKAHTAAIAFNFILILQNS